MRYEVFNFKIQVAFFHTSRNSGSKSQRCLRGYYVTDYESQNSFRQSATIVVPPRHPVMRSGLSSLGMVSDFLFSTTDFSKALLESDGNTEWVITRCAVMCWVQTVRLTDAASMAWPRPFAFTVRGWKKRHLCYRSAYWFEKASFGSGLYRCFWSWGSDGQDCRWL